MDDARESKTYDPVVTSLIVLGLIFAITATRHATTSEILQPAPQTTAAINPNTAPWWELMVLPDIGEATARKIVEHRDAHSDQKPIFNGPADLEPVPGIGPKTIQRIGPYLRFND